MFKSTLLALAAASFALTACETTTVTTMMVSPAEANCLAAVASTTGTADVSTISMAPSGSGTRVLIQVEEATAPWECIANADGSVADVNFTTEG